MGHGLMEHDTMVSGELITPWHGIGTVVPGLLSSTEALKLGGLDWTVRLEPIFFKSPNGMTASVADRFATVREDIELALGVVGSDYKVVNNVDAFAFMDSIMDTGEAKYTTAGSLFNGAKVFLTAKIGDAFTVAGSDAHESYLLLSTSHDGSSAITAAIVTIRVVCNNTLTWALNGAKTRWSITHRSTLEGKTAEAMQTLGLVHKYEDAFQSDVEKLIAAELDKDRFLEIVKDLLPDQKRQTEKNLEQLAAAWDADTNPEGNNAWHGVNALTYWTDNIRTYRSDEARFKTLTDGFAAGLRNKARKAFLVAA